MDECRAAFRREAAGMVAHRRDVLESFAQWCGTVRDALAERDVEVSSKLELLEAWTAEGVEGAVREAARSAAECLEGREGRAAALREEWRGDLRQALRAAGVEAGLQLELPQQQGSAEQVIGRAALKESLNCLLYMMQYAML